MTVVDTTFLIDLMRGEAGAVRVRDTYAGEGWSLHVTDVSLHELHRGLAQARVPPDEHGRIQAALEATHGLPLDSEAARIGGQIEGALKAHGRAIDVEDCMIAAIALRHGLGVITRNQRHFGRIDGLSVQTY